jgi:hypothetical protein
MGMADSTTFRLSEARHLNDSQDLKDFVWAIRLDINRRIKEYNATRTQATSMDFTSKASNFFNMRSFESWLHMKFGSDDWMIFVGSFTEEGNLLSQWRGYCPYGQGVRLLTLASLMKHVDFKEENEWRVVRPACPFTSIEGLQFRQGRSALVPYVELKLPIFEDGRLLIDQIMLGPTSNEDLAFHALTKYMKLKTKCGAVYRTWVEAVERLHVGGHASGTVT